ncbi:SDR family oxidoreductase [Actinocrinis puniceicyclus]|uniref:SDR family oxidoreductase n=1 Tax=Actinocrinis puniceicyclus TaxID=977794 RepID=A0A8J8BBH9_9ACTN|nr:SDR family oxidoreductase [Actinocrinis puniceicyclus]MBS2964072.1 SDR family oxidoreductase [Actinocrinis puniceicyclus]
MRVLDELFSLTGRTALVTGGSSGIGGAMAEAIASAGARTVLLARDREKLAAAARRIRQQGGQADWVSADVADRARLAEAAEAAVRLVGEIDILVNCAGINPRPPLGEQSLDDYDGIVAANLTGPFQLGQRFGPRMAERGWGRIINIGSQQSVSAFGDSGVYGVAKAGLAGLTRSQAEAWSPRGVCVNTVVPGFVVTPLTAAAASEPRRVEALASRTMAGRNGLPEDFRGVALFLASDACAYVTGQLLFVDGGFSVH